MLLKGSVRKKLAFCNGVAELRWPSCAKMTKTGSSSVLSSDTIIDTVMVLQQTAFIKVGKITFISHQRVSPEKGNISVDPRLLSSPILTLFHRIFASSTTAVRAPIYLNID